MDTEKIKEITKQELDGSNLFLVEINTTPHNEIEVVIDSDNYVDIENCIELSRVIESHFDRDEEDFQLTVTSAGVGYPLKVYRQYLKLIGRPVEVILKSGVKILAELRQATEDSITLAYTEKRLVEGKKKKEEFEVVNTYTLAEIKTTKEYLDFK